MYSQIELTYSQGFSVEQGPQLITYERYPWQMNRVLGLKEEVGLACGVGCFGDAQFASKVCDLVLGLEEDIGLACGVGSFGQALFASEVCDLILGLQDIGELGVGWEVVGDALEDLVLSLGEASVDWCEDDKQKWLPDVICKLEVID